VTVTLNDYRPVAIISVPAAMQSAVMLVEPDAGAAIVITVTIIISVAPDAEAKTLSARNCGRRNRNGR
jgi:cell division protein FtsW (lipid II flippase)